MWRVEPLSTHVRIMNGGTPSTKNHLFWNGEIGWLSVDDFNKDIRYVFFAKKSIAEPGLRYTGLLRKGQLIISARGTVGVVAQVGNDLAFNQSCFGLDCIETWSNDFLYYYLSNSRRQLNTMSKVNVFSSISADVFDIFLVPVPTKKEQSNIVAILTSTDEAIAASRTLVEKYAVIKQGLMQDLLGKGEKVCLKKLGGRFIRGHGITRADIQSEGAPCIRYGELYTTYDTWLVDPISHISEQLANRCLHINNGDLLFTLSGETAEEIGKTVAYLGKEKVVIGGDLAVFTGHKQNPLYLAYILNAPNALKQKELRATGSMVVHINSKKLEEISVPLPSLPEQERIVQILTAADERLTAERNHLKKLKAIKQGLMNDLLTNKVSTDQLQGGILDGEQQNEQ